MEFVFTPFRRHCPDSGMSATGHPGDDEPRSHRVGYPEGPGTACLKFFDRRTGVILNRPIDAYSATRRVGSEEPRRSVSPVGRGAFGILQANTSGTCRLDALNQLHSGRTAYPAPIANVTPAITATTTFDMLLRSFGRPNMGGQQTRQLRRGLGGAARG